MADPATVQPAALGPASQPAVYVGRPPDVNPAVKSTTLSFAIADCLAELDFGTQQANTVEDALPPLPTKILPEDVVEVTNFRLKNADCSSLATISSPPVAQPVAEQIPTSVFWAFIKTNAVSALG